MKLSDLARNILNEDTWGNNPSAAGSMSPGKSPTAVSPAPQQSGNAIDISNEFKNFKVELEKQEEAAIKKLVDQLNKQFLKKKVKVNASKGSVGQIEKEYDILVNRIEVRRMKDQYYIVFTGKSGNESDSEYFVEDSQIKVSPATSAQPSSVAPSLKNVGGVVPMKPVNQMSTTKRNILPQG